MSRNQTLLNPNSPNCSCAPNLHIPIMVWAVLVLSLVVKLSLITLNGGEYTDGIVQIELWRSPVVFFPPGYSAAVWGLDKWIGNLLISGRLVSILASIGSLYVCYLLARSVLKNPKEASLAVLFLALSPIYNRWSLRVMTDSLFLLLFLICCLQYVNLLQSPQRSPLRFLGWIGIATLVRYQGLFFLPFALYFLWFRRRNLIERNVVRTFIAACASFLPWLLLAVWIMGRGFGHAQQFTERASFGFWTTLSLYFNMFESFAIYWPWAITYGLFACGFVGCMSLYRSDANERRFLLFCGIAVIVFLGVQSCFLSFQYRYLLPLVPLWCILSARGWRQLEYRVPYRWLRRTLAVLVILNLVGLSAAVLYFQRATFGDIAESAKFLQSAKFQRMVTDETRILSDELYRQGVYNVKMNFWAGNGREILFYPLTEPKAGDVVVLHNAYTDLQKAKERLEERFELTVMQTWSSNALGGSFTTLPLLPDIMVNPPAPPLTSNPQCMSFRFAPQPYYSVALMLKEK